MSTSFWPLCAQPRTVSFGICKAIDLRSQYLVGVDLQAHQIDIYCVRNQVTEAEKKKLIGIKFYSISLKMLRQKYFPPEVPIMAQRK